MIGRCVIGSDIVSEIGTKRGMTEIVVISLFFVNSLVVTYSLLTCRLTSCSRYRMEGQSYYYPAAAVSNQINSCPALDQDRNMGSSKVLFSQFGVRYLFLGREMGVLYS